MNTGWRFLNTGFGSGAHNMEFDEKLAQELLSGAGAPTLRLFQWKPWAISLGHNQRVEDINVEKCQEDGIDVVRRPTGGRAILHAEELTYSVVMHAEGKGVLQIYNEISNALVAGLRLFGVEVSLQRSQPNLSEQYRRVSGIACFSSSARYEIEYDGRKLVGSAQRRFGDGAGDVVLQHGSILCGAAHKNLVNYLRLDDRLAVGLSRELSEGTIDLSDICGRGIDVEALSLCIKDGFETEWGFKFEKLEQTDEFHAVSYPSTNQEVTS